MKTKSKNKSFLQSYAETSNEARRLQSELLDLVDGMLTVSWPVAQGGLVMQVEILGLLDRLEEDSYYRLNPVCVGLIQTIRKVVALQEKSYDVRQTVYSD